MNKIVSIIVLLSISGCYQSVNSWDIERAIKYCEGLDNVVKMEATFNGIELVQCKNKLEDAKILP